MYDHNLQSAIPIKAARIETWRLPAGHSPGLPKPYLAAVLEIRVRRQMVKGISSD